MNWKILNSVTLFHHPRITLIEDEVQLPGGETTQYLRFKDSGGGSDIVAMNNQGKILLQQEYNHPVGKLLWQFPGGLKEKSESYEDAAKRELIEETGYQTNNLQYLGQYYNNRRRTSEISKVYCATELEKIDHQTELEEESLKHVWFSIKEIDDLIKNQEIVACDALAIWMIFTSQRSKQ